MAYTALYRKYRPQSFDEVVGQSQIVQTLNNAIQRNRIAHAYLFSGPRGTGKTSIAKIFAKTLNCTGSHPPCGECENCQMAAAGTHPDIIEIDAASNNGVDEVRNLIELVNYAPIHGKYKIYIIDEVHMMTTGAFNALLKTIEEPPAHAIFIFATTEPHKVLPTILSRCQRFDFSKVSESQIQSRLAYVCDQEDVKYQEDGLALISVLADGGMRDSLSILDQCIAYSPDLVDAETVRQIYGLATEEDIGRIFNQLNPNSAPEAVKLLDELNESGMDLKRFLSDFIQILKNSLIMDFGSKTDLVPDRHKHVIEKYFRNSDPEKRIDLLDSLMDTYNKLSFASNILDYIETALLKNSYSKFQKKLLTHEIHQEDIQKDQIISDSGHKKSDVNIPQASTANSHPISQRFWKSDVSRETSTTCETILPTVILEDEFILSLLNGGNKDERKSDIEKMKSLQIYESEMGTAKFAISLKNAAIEASSPTFILVSVPSKIEVNQINEFQKTEGYEILTERMLGKPKAVYSIVKSRVPGLFKLFKKRWTEKTLPPAYTAPVRKISMKDKPEEDPESAIRSFFPDVVVQQD